VPTTGLISADSHINEPPDLWLARVPAAMRDQVPRVVPLPEGDAWVMFPGAAAKAVGLANVAGRKPEEFASKPVTYKEMRPGAYDPTARLVDQDVDGVRAEVLYPSPGVAASLDVILDLELRALCTRVYNDWIADYQAYAPDRLVGVGVLPPVEDGDVAEAELRRIRDLGLRTAALTLGEAPTTDPRGERVWAAAEETGLVVALHIGSGRPHNRGQEYEGFGLPGTREGRMVMNTFALAEQIGILMFSGLMDRHPNLKVVVAESGIGWIPYCLERLDYIFDRHRSYMGSAIERRPSEIWFSQFAATFQDEEFGAGVIDQVGVGNVMWASDFPHSATTWPNSVAVIDKLLGARDPVLRERIVAGNAAALYGL
jgi:predicted TIM-barrel fold metal-dependent hydrolase